MLEVSSIPNIKHQNTSPSICVISEDALWTGIVMLSAKLLSAISEFLILYTGVKSRPSQSLGLCG